MKRLFSIIIIAAICLSMASCSLIKKIPLSPEKEISSTSLFSATETSDATQSEPDITAKPTQAETTSAVPTDNKQLYLDYIAANEERYSVYEGESSTFEPIYLYIDLDDDSVDELVYFREFYSENYFTFSFAYVYMFDIIDGNVTEFFGSENVAQCRLADSIRVFKDDGQYYITRDWNDGRYVQKGTLYTYNGEEPVPVYSIHGMYNDPSFYTVSYLGDDIFEGESSGFSDITEEEFENLQNDIYKKGETIFSSDKSFID